MWTEEKKEKEEQKAKDERGMENRGAGGAQLLSALLRALVFWLLPHFQILCPALMSPNLATRLCSCLFSALRDSVMDSSHRADLRLLLPPSLPPELIRGQWAGKKQQGGGRRGWRGEVTLVGAIVVLPERRRDRYQLLLRSEDRR